MNRLIAIYLMLALAACAGRISESDKMVDRKTGESVKLERIYHHNGGFARSSYQGFQDAIAEHGYEGFIIDGSCTSACVYFALYSPRSCYTRSARLGLHLATSYGFGTGGGVDEFNEKVLAYLPKPIADKLRQIGNVTVLGGEDVTFEWLVKHWPEGFCDEKYITSH